MNHCWNINFIKELSFLECIEMNSCNINHLPKVNLVNQILHLS